LAVNPYRLYMYVYSYKWICQVTFYSFKHWNK